MVYEPTQPRGPVATDADNQGPGPAAYELPPLVGSKRHDPQSRYFREPAWYLGTNARAPHADDGSPGPVYPDKPTVTRYGQTGGPHFSLHSRQEPLKPESEYFPGPGTYNPNKADPVIRRSYPRYSMRLKPMPTDLSVKPGPNAYGLDPMMGKTKRSTRLQAPMYSVYGRLHKGSFAEDLHKTPGPAAYAAHDPDTTKKKLPAFTLRPKTEVPGFIGHGEDRPGPGSHRPEKVTTHLKASPRFSFGVRHSQHELPAFMDIFH